MLNNAARCAYVRPATVMEPSSIRQPIPNARRFRRSAKSAGRRPEALSADNRPREASKMGQNDLFLASFSCFGHTLACAAPGVGIVSTVPDRNGFVGAYMEMDGTSMASPAACGTLAVILSQDATYENDDARRISSHSERHCFWRSTASRSVCRSSSRDAVCRRCNIRLGVRGD